MKRSPAIVEIGYVRLSEYEELEKELVRTKMDLAMREQQIGFTDSCSAHGKIYSDYCGACKTARNINEYGR